MRSESVMRRSEFLMLIVAAFLSLVSGLPIAPSAGGGGFTNSNAVASRFQCAGEQEGILRGPLNPFLHNSGESRCLTVRDVRNELHDAVSDMKRKSHDAAVDDVMQNIAEAAVDTLSSFFFSGGSARDYDDYAMCLDDFNGSDTRTDKNLIDSGCDMLPIADEGRWSILAFNLPAIQAICPSVTGAMSMCLAFSILECNNMPSVAISLNKNLIACVLKSAGSTSASAGLSGLLGTAVEVGLDKVAAGVSTTNFFSAETRIFTGKDGIQDFRTQGIYFDHIKVKISPKTFQLPDWVSISGHYKRVVSAPGVEHEFSQLIEAFDSRSGDDILDAMANLRISVLLEGKLTFALKFKKPTKGILPDLPAHDVAMISGFATTYWQRTTTGIHVPAGVYFYAGASSPAVAVIKSVGKTVLKAVDGLMSMVGWFAKVKGAEDNVSALVDQIDENLTASMEFGMLVNTETVEVMIKFVLTSRIEVGVHCAFNYNKERFSCHLDIGGVEKYFTAAIQWVENKATWVVKEATDFFEETGGVIAAAFADAERSVEAFSKETIQDTADFINDAANTVSAELRSWAVDAKFACGWQTVESAAECGTEHIASGARCGWTTVTSAAQCGSRIVNDAFTCGTTIVRDGAICGWDFVTDGAVCGWDTVWGCISSLFSDCKKAKSCQIPKSCSIAATCAVPNTCTVAKTCSVPKTCNIPVDC